MTAGPEGECLRRATHDRARDRSRMAETPCGSVHESPVRGQRTRATLKAGAASLECITENFCKANAGMGQLHIVSRRNSSSGSGLLWCLSFRQRQGLTRFQCKVKDRFVGLSADNSPKSYASRPAA